MNSTGTDLKMPSAFEKRLRQVKVRKALEPEDLRKYHGISEDSSAAHYFKNSKEVLELMQKESDFSRRAEIRETMKSQIREISKR